MTRELLYEKIVLKLVSENNLRIQLLLRQCFKGKHELAVIVLGEKKFTCSHLLRFRSSHSFWDFFVSILKVNSIVVFGRVRTTILFLSTHPVYTFVLYNSLSKFLINLSERLRNKSRRLSSSTKRNFK